MLLGDRQAARETRLDAALADMEKAASMKQGDYQIDYHLGLAHFIEHMAFNGSRNFKPGELIATFEATGARMGPHVNAYTSFDETVYMLQLPTDKEGLVRKGLVALSDFAGKTVDTVGADRTNNRNPMWMGGRLYFLSDRDWAMNVWSYDTKAKKLEQVTQFADYDIKSLEAGGGAIVFEQAGYLHLFDPASSRAKKLTVGVAADLPETRPRFARETKDRKYIREFSISPTGVRLAVNFRGEIVTIPAEKGDVRNLTNTTGVHERSPIWSPDGKSIAYFSDESGEYQLHIDSQDGKGKTKKFKLNGAGFYEFPAWSPDSKKIAFVDNSRTLYWIDVAKGDVKKVASDYFYGPFKFLHPSWAPDSKWIAYAINNQAYVNRVYVYSLEQDKAFPVTDGLSDASEPVFDRSGKYLYFLASTDYGPRTGWLEMSSVDRPVMNWLS